MLGRVALAIIIAASVIGTRAHGAPVLSAISATAPEGQAQTGGIAHGIVAGSPAVGSYLLAFAITLLTRAQAKRRRDERYSFAAHG